MIYLGWQAAHMNDAECGLLSTWVTTLDLSFWTTTAFPYETMKLHIGQEYTPLTLKSKGLAWLKVAGH